MDEEGDDDTFFFYPIRYISRLAHTYFLATGSALLNRTTTHNNRSTTMISLGKPRSIVVFDNCNLALLKHVKEEG